MSCVVCVMMEETAVSVKPDNVVALRKPQEEPSKPKKKVLDEDEYVEVILQSTLILKCSADMARYIRELLFQLQKRS